MDLLRVSSPYKSMIDSQKEKLLRNWIENYSERFKKVQELKNKISDYVKIHNRDDIPSYVDINSLRKQETIVVLANEVWRHIYYNLPNNSYDLIDFLNKKLSLFDNYDKDLKIIMTVDYGLNSSASEKPIIVRSSDNFPWVKELQKMLDEYIISFRYFLADVSELLGKFNKTLLRSENKILNLIKYGRVEEINL